MADLFLSYAHADEARARPLVEALESRGLSVWWDPHIAHGSDFRAGILQQISNASCVVVLWSRASLDSPYVIGEATAGMEGGKLLPVFLERNLKVPLGLGHLQAADLSDWGGPAGQAQLERLVDSIRAFAIGGEAQGAQADRAIDFRSLAPSEIRARARYLKDARRHIENMLKASIHSARFLDLGVADTPRAAQLPWAYKDATIEQEFGSVADAFEAFDRRMLLLGAPGAGKTVTLLHLALILIDEAERSSAAAVPVVVNLSKFAIEPEAPSLIGRLLPRQTEREDTNRSFEEWLGGELAERGVSRADAARWVEEGRVAALLDGLDEVNDERRADMAELLNTTYFKQHPHSVVVVCSRSADYQPLQDRVTTRLRLTGAVTLQPLGRKQIEAYLTAARASGLRHALGMDDALFELARTPLTLSMMTLAYGGRSAEDIPSFGPQTDRRHHLLEAFVARMLQRKERRARGIPFDDDMDREIAAKSYRYHPDRVNAYLGWLATCFSIRTQTSCSLRRFYSFLGRTASPDQSPDVWTIRSARTIFLAALLAIVGATLMPKDAAAIAVLAGVTAGCVVTYLAHSALRAQSSDYSQWIVMGISVFLIGLGFAAISRSLSILLPFDLAPIPAGLLTLAVVGSAIGGALEQASGKKRAVMPTMALIGFSGGAALLYFGMVTWAGGMPLAAAAVGGLMAGLAIVLAREEAGGPIETAKAIGVTLVVLGMILVVQRSGLALLGAFHWGVAFALVGGASVLIAADSPRSSLPLLAFAMTAVVGQLLAGKEGGILGVAFLGLGWLAWNLAMIENTFRGTRVAVAWRELADRCEAWIEQVALSPMTAMCLAPRGRLPWRLRRFLRYAGDALLLKPFDGEIEFAHRLLRDYFALRELVPQLGGVDPDTRMRAIAALGFQGVSAVDTLGELALEGSVEAKVLAIQALGRIAAPEATHFLERALADSSPEVRAVVIGSLRSTDEDQRERLWRQAAGDESPLVGRALIDAVVDLDSDARGSLVARVLKRQSYPVELLRYVCVKADLNDSARALASHVGATLPEEARVRAEALLSDADARVRERACEWVPPGSGGPPEMRRIVDLLRTDPVPAVRAAAAAALERIHDAAAVPHLIDALTDDAEKVRRSAAWAMSKFEDERVMAPLVSLLDDKSKEIRRLGAKLLGQTAEERAVLPLIRTLTTDEAVEVRSEAARSLTELGDARAVAPLMGCLEHPNDTFWEWAAVALRKLDADRASAALRPFLSDKSLMKRIAAMQTLAPDLDPVPSALLSRDVDDAGLWVDPLEPITRERVARCARVLKISEDEVRAHYEALAPDFKLRLKW